MNQRNSNEARRRTLASMALIGSIGLMTSCSSVPPANPAIAQARAAYDAAVANPAVASNAQAELQQARIALTRAETSWDKDEDPVEARHLAYLASQQVAIANEVAERATTAERIRSAEAERERVRAEARAREVQTARAQADAEADRARRLETELKDLQAKQTARGTVVTLGDVLFDTGSATLRPGAQTSIVRLAEALRSNPDRRVLIEGHTDSVGSEASNQLLSERRAEAVRAALIANNVAPERIQVLALGESVPVASNETAAGRQQNRRVEVVFSSPGGQFVSR